MRTRRSVAVRRRLREQRRHKRHLAVRLVAVIAALLVTVLPVVAWSQDASSDEKLPECSALDPSNGVLIEAKRCWGSWSWSQTLLKPGNDRHVLFGARVAGKAQLPLGVRVFGRADASALQDGAAIDQANAVSITDPESFTSLELYAGAYRPIRGPFALAAVYGLALDVEGGKVNAVERYPQTWGAGVRVGSFSGAWAYALLGKHEASGSGVRLLLTAQVPIDGRISLVGDGAIGGDGTFGRGGVAVRLK